MISLLLRTMVVIIIFVMVVMINIFDDDVFSGDMVNNFECFRHDRDITQYDAQTNKN